MPAGCSEEAGSRLPRQHRGHRPPAADQTAAGRFFPAVLQHGGELRLITGMPVHRETKLTYISTVLKFVFWHISLMSWEDFPVLTLNITKHNKKYPLFQKQTSWKNVFYDYVQYLYNYFIDSYFLLTVQLCVIDKIPRLQTLCNTANRIQKNNNQICHAYLIFCVLWVYISFSLSTVPWSNHLGKNK